MATPQKQWIEYWPDQYDDDTGEILSPGGDAYCMTAICDRVEWEELLARGWKRWYGTCNRVFNPETRMYDGVLDTINIRVKTMDAEEYASYGGDPQVARAHGYDTHPNLRRSACI